MSSPSVSERCEMLRRLAASVGAHSIKVGSVRAQVETRGVPRGATESYLWQNPGQPQVPRWDADKAIQSAYLGELYTYRCVESISNSIAGLPFRAGLDPEAPSSYSLAAPLARLLGPPPGNPNPIWAGREIVRYSVAQYLLAGKFAWLKEYAPGTRRVVALWPLQAQHLRPIAAAKGSQHYFSGYRYQVQGGRYIDYRLDEVVYCWKKSVDDPRQPETVLQAGSSKVAVAQMLTRFDYSFFKNNGVPSTIVTTEPFAEPEQRRSFREQFVGSFGGYDNGGKTLFLEADPDEDGQGGLTSNVSAKISVERLGLTAREAQLDTKALEIKRDTALMWGVPVSILGDASERTYSNSGQEATNYWTETLVPKCSDLADQINLTLAAELSSTQVGWFDLSKVKALSPPPPEPSALQALHNAGLVTRDEVRERLSLRPWSEVPHDEPEPVITADVITPPVIVPDTRRRYSVPMIFRAALHACELCESLDGRINPNFGEYDLPHPNCECSLVPLQARAAVDHSESMRGLLEAQIRKVLGDLQTSALSRAKGKRGRQGTPLPDLIDPDFWEERIALELAPVCGAVAAVLNIGTPPARDLARRIVEDTRLCLTAYDTVEGAFADAEQRARNLADTRMPVPIQTLVCEIVEAA